MWRLWTFESLQCQSRLASTHLRFAGFGESLQHELRLSSPVGKLLEAAQSWLPSWGCGEGLTEIPRRGKQCEPVNGSDSVSTSLSGASLMREELN